MRGQGIRGTRVLAILLLLAVSLASSAAGAGEIRGHGPTVTEAEQAPTLLFLLTVLMTVARNTSADHAGTISDPAAMERAPILLYADAEDSKDWMRGCD